MTDLCEKTDLPVAQCGHCQGQTNPPKARALMRMEANFSNSCPGCGAWINEGDDVYLIEPKEPWVCGKCGGL